MTDIHAISSYGPSAASTRVRLYDWFRFLGIEATHHCYGGLNNNRPSSIASHAAQVVRAEFSLRRLDLKDHRVILSREASPFSRGHIEERLLRNAGHGAYDLDDALFHDQSPFRRLLGTQDKCRRAVAAADVVIAGNEYLANWAEGHSRDVRLIPSCVNPRDYAPKADWSIKGDVPMLVWLGSPATEHYVAQVASALLEINRRTGALLTVISGSGSDRNATLKHLHHMIRRVPWSVETFASYLASADVAIAPLDDSPYSRGKCAYKLLQYAASALPMIGSPVGANAIALRKFDGIAAHTKGDWVDGLLQLFDEPNDRRTHRGRCGLQGVSEHYDFKGWSNEWTLATGLARR